MDFMNQVAGQWKKLQEKMQLRRQQGNHSQEPLNTRILRFWHKAVKFKKLLLAVPVAALAIILAMTNLFKLPALVGLGMQADGEYSIHIIREVAVVGPMAITALCLLLMFASKRTLTPWMVSQFSLLLPLMILITNTFPG